MSSQVLGKVYRSVCLAAFAASAMTAASAYAHHEALFGPQASAALSPTLFSVEKRPVAGAGIAVNPIDDEEHGKLLSFQLGTSYEETSREGENGAPGNLSGGTGVFLHPSLVCDIGTHIQIFNLISLPVTQNWRDSNDQQRFRLGSGAIFKL